MSTEFFNDQWRIINEPNQNKVSNYSCEFDGTSSLVNIDTINSSISSSAKGSVSCWVKWDGSNALRSVGFGSNSVDRQYIVIQINPDGKAYAQYKTSSITGWQLRTTSSITANVWTHFVIVQNGTSPIIYINGSVPSQSFVEATNKTRWWPNLNSFNTSTIGALRWNSSGTLVFTYGTGKIDQVCIFDYALSATQVSTLYGGGTAVTNPMSLSPKPIYFAQLGDQSVSTGANYLVPNNSLSDYVFNFDSNLNSLIQLAVAPTLTSVVTLSVWIRKFTGIPGSAAILGIRNFPNSPFQSPYRLNCDTSATKLQFSITQTNGNVKTVNSATTQDINVWYHVMGVADGTNATLYINGVQDGTPLAYDGTLLAPNAPLFIGAQGTISSLRPFDFNGEISNCAMWDTNLSPTQVESVYNNGAPDDISGLNPLSWWKLNAADTFNSSTGNWTIKDYGSGSNNGTSSGMTSANLVESDLQHTSGFSPYALTLDSNDANQLILNNGGNAILNGATSLTVSAWINPTADTGTAQNIFTNWAGNIMIRFSTLEAIQVYLNGVSPTLTGTANGTITFGEWQHIVVTYSGSEVKIYRNNILIQTGSATGTLGTSAGTDIIGNRPATTQFFNGKMSNVAVWKNSVIDVNTLYNQGVPADLTSLSPTGWWQLGSNSSFNSGVWTCLNQGTGSTSAVPANATSTATMTNDDITNGVGYSANGLGTSSIDIIGDAPYSTANGLSENMDVLDRTIDVPG